MLLFKLLNRKYLILGLSAVALAGCGYQPLLGQQQNQINLSVRQELSRIWISEIPNREGQHLFNELSNLINVKGRPQKPKYKLSVSYTEASSGLGIGKDAFATRANHIGEAQFTLSGPTIKNYQGKSKVIVSYNILTSPTGTEFAQEEASKRAAKSMAQDIFSKLSAVILNIQTKK